MHIHKTLTDRVPRSLILLLAGALASFALPPVGWVVFLFFSFPVLVRYLETLDKSSLWASFIVGWWFGLGYFVAGLYWLVVALGVEWQRFFWLVPFTLLGLPSILAIFTGLATAATSLTRTTGLAQHLAFALSWSAFEWLRGHLFTGFPWNLLGYAWDPYLPMLQLTAYTGIYGLSLLTVLMACLPAVWLNPQATLKTRLMSSGTLITLGLTIWSLGTWRLSLHHSPDSYQSLKQPLMLRLVQPNIPQTLKWDPKEVRTNFLKLLKLSSQSSPTPINTLIWPESALPVFLDEDNEVRRIVAGHIPSQGVLLTGAIHREIYNQRTVNIWNSLMALDKEGRVLEIYDKTHLVPFGEYIPFRRFLPAWIRKVTPGELDYSAGHHLKTVILPKSLSLVPLPPFSPLVCYEAIFPGAVINKKDARPSWLLNVTNDAWYGITFGPYQHFAMVRVRAIEEGMPLVRAANNGISGVVDAYGRILATLGLGETGILDVELPPALLSPPLYSRLGDWMLVCLWCVLSLITVVCRWIKI